MEPFHQGKQIRVCGAVSVIHGNGHGTGRRGRASSPQVGNKFTERDDPVAVASHVPDLCLEDPGADGHGIPDCRTEPVIEEHRHGRGGRHWYRKRYRKKCRQQNSRYQKPYPAHIYLLSRDSQPDTVQNPVRTVAGQPTLPWKSSPEFSWMLPCAGQPDFSPGRSAMLATLFHFGSQNPSRFCVQQFFGFRENSAIFLGNVGPAP